MIRPFVRLFNVFGAALAACLVLASPGVFPDCRTAGSAQAQEAAAGKAMPLAVVQIAGVERMLTEIDVMFDAAGRPELSETMAIGLAAVGDLKGLDRDKPLGIMVFLPTEALLPQPKVVGFVPVENIDDLIATAARGPIKIEKVVELENRYEIINPRNTLQVLYRGGYAFIANNDDDLEFDFPDPAGVTSQLTSRYDVAASLNLKGVPKSVRNLFLDFMRASVESELQRRDDESEGQHRIRKARGMNLLETVELLLTEGEELTVGWGVSPERRDAHLELVVKAAPDSDFAQRLQDIGGRSSHFSAILDDPAPLTIAASWMLDPSGRKTVKETFAGAQLDLTARLGEAGGDPRRFDDLFKPLMATADAGHVDFVAQFVGEPPGNAVLVGGVKVADGQTLTRGLEELIRQIQAQNRDEQRSFDLHVSTHQGVSFHRWQGGTQPDPGRDRFFGGQPAMYVGVGDDVLWFAVGADEALPTLRAKMDKLAEQAAGGRGSEAPFQIRAHMQHWLALFSNAGQRGPAGLAREAFAEGNDVLRIDVRPTDTGARFRVGLDTGFVRFVGLAVARRIDGRLER